jgi:outer membrane murein-binding lipoprotein Lpp
LISKNIQNKSLATQLHSDIVTFFSKNYDLSTKGGVKTFLNDGTKARSEFVVGLATSVGSEALNLIVDKISGNTGPFWTELRHQLIDFSAQVAAGGARGGIAGADAAGIQAVIGQFMQIGSLVIEITTMNNETRANLQTVASQFEQLAKTADQNKAKKYAAAAQQAREEMSKISGWRQYLP